MEVFPSWDSFLVSKIYEMFLRVSLFEIYLRVFWKDNYNDILLNKMNILRIENISFIVFQHI